MLDDSTKSNLLRAAISVFGTHGFSGSSVRQIAAEAKTNIGAIKYHYGSKENLWKDAITHLFQALGAYITRDMDAWPSMTAYQRVVNSTRNYIHFCAQHPELNRMVLSETIQNGDRMHWLAENHIKLFIEQSAAWMTLAQEDGIYPKEISVLNLVFISMSVSQYLFLMAPFVEHAAGIDVFENDQIEKHVDAVVRLLLNKAESSESGLDAARSLNSGGARALEDQKHGAA